MIKKISGCQNPLGLTYKSYSEKIILPFPKKLMSLDKHPGLKIPRCSSLYFAASGDTLKTCDVLDTRDIAANVLLIVPPFFPLCSFNTAFFGINITDEKKLDCHSIHSVSPHNADLPLILISLHCTIGSSSVLSKKDN